MFNLIVSDSEQYLEPFNCAKNELRLVKKGYQQNMFTNHMY